VRRLCEILLLGVIAALPFEYYFQKDTPLFTSLKLALALFGSCWIVMMGVERIRFRGGISLPSKRFTAALLIFVLSQVLAALLAREFQRNAAQAAAKAALGAVLAIATADLIRKSGKPLEMHVLAALAVTGATAAIVGLGQLAGIEIFDRIVDIFQSHHYLTGSRWRLSSTMEYPNTTASFLIATFLAGAALVSVANNWIYSRASILVWIVLIAAQGLALLLTYSRGAIGSLILALAITAGFFKKLAPDRYWKTAAATSLTLMLAGLPVLFSRPMATLPEYRAARYGLAASEEIKYLLPDREYRESLMVRNVSSLPWLRDGFGVGYRWSNLNSGVRTQLREAARFSADLAVGHEQTLEVTFRTPPEKGEYFLVWFIIRHDPAFQEVERSFSPAVVCVIHEPGQKPPALSREIRRYLHMVQQERRALNMKSVPTRLHLWRAALQIWRSSPLVGIGPDNFRLAKWKYMGIPKGDETILANNLYLEVLAGSGLLGLASLLWLLGEAGRILTGRLRQARSTAELTIAWFATAFFLAFLIHGLVDYFLKFTPTFALFWIMLGLLCAGTKITAEAQGRREEI
jgi:O-antigen ligase